MIIYFARHAESLANTGKIISNRDKPHPLTAKGREQAAMLAERLANSGLTTIYCSPVPRALETASIVSRQLNLPLRTADGLREFDCGMLEGRSSPFAWMLFSMVLHQWFERGRVERRFIGGESFLDVRQRFMSLMDELRSQYDQTDARILCVTHAGALHIGLTGLLSDLPFEMVTGWSIPYTATIKTIHKNGAFSFAGWDGVTRQPAA